MISTTTSHQWISRKQCVKAVHNQKFGGQNLPGVTERANIAYSEYDKKYDNNTIMESDFTPTDVLAMSAKPACNTGFFILLLFGHQRLVVENVLYKIIEACKRDFSRCEN